MSFEKFHERYWPRLVRYLSTQASNSSWAEDVAIETMIAVWDKWDEMLVMDRPDSYMFTIATRKLYRLEARAREHCCLEEDLASSDRALRIAAEGDKWIDDHFDLLAAMRALPRRQCQVLGLHYFAGFTLADTAKLMGITEGAAKTHLSRGLASLRQRLGVLPAPKTRKRVPA